MEVNCPIGWEITTFGKVVNARMGKTILSKELKKKGLPVFSAATENTVWGYTDDESVVFESGTIVISARGTIGAAKIPKFDKFVSTQTTIAATPSKEIDSKYIAFQLACVKWSEYTSTTAIPMLTISALSKLPIVLAPLNEQRRIVEKIESLFAQLDAGEAALKQVQQQLARYRQSVLKAAVTGALTADWRAENAHRLEHGRDLLARILKTRRENWQGRGKYKEPAVPDTSGLPELPQGWVWVSLEQLFDIYGGATPSRRDAKNWGGDLPWVSSGEVAFCRIETTKELITQAGYKSCSAKLHPVGTILLAMIGEGKTRGQAAILGIPACNNQNAAAIRVSESEIPSKFVYFYLMGRYEQSRKEGQGGNQPALNGAKVKAFLMPLACVDEMEEVVRKIEIAFDAAALTEIAIKTELTRAAALRQSILKDAFSGKLVPQDPNDEPADVLLARIRAERAQNIPAKTARGRKPSVRTKT